MPKSLLKQLESLPHHERMQRMVELGRAAASTPGAARKIAALAEGDFYERFLALQSCFGSRDADYVLGALADESRFLRACAAKMVAHICDDQQAVTALLTAPDYLRSRLLHSLAKKRRAVIDLYLRGVAAAGDDERLLAALPFGSPDVVREHLPALLPLFGAEDWRRLARLHPDLLAATLAHQAADEAEPEPQLLRRVTNTLPLLVKRDPDTALALVEGVVERLSLQALDVQALAHVRSEQVAQLVLRQDNPETAGIDFHDHVRRLEQSTIIALIRRNAGLDNWTENWFPRLPPAQRGAVYAAARLGWYTRAYEGVLNTELVAALPGAAREREARHNLDLPVLQTRPTQRIPYAAFLPWDEARAFLAPYLNNPDADLRGAALAALAGATRYDRARLGDLLDLLVSRRNEQDPVRAAMLDALAELPPARWLDEHLDRLNQVIRHAFDAPDLSPRSTSAIERLLLRVLLFHPQWSAERLATLLRERGVFVSGLPAQNLTAAAARVLADALLPVLKALLSRDLEQPLLSVANGLAARLGALDDLVAMLERTIKKTRRRETGLQLLSLLQRYRPDCLPTLVPDLLAKDESWVLVPEVRAYLNRRRQDLLPPFLAYRPYRGRYSDGKAPQLVQFQPPFYHWTARQQLAYARALADQSVDQAPTSPRAHFEITILPQLPAVSLDRLRALIGGDVVVIRQLALQALGRLDTGAGVPLLLQALGEEDGRIAVYALRRVLREMPGDQALALLRQVPLQRVVVAKEVVRLLGELHADDAYRDLLALAAGDLHRDVRVALIGALANYLEHDESWPILTAAAGSEDAAPAMAVARLHVERLSRLSESRLINLALALLDHPDPQVRRQTLISAPQLPLRDPARLLLQRILPLLASPLSDEGSSAASAAFAIARPDDASTVAAGIAHILADRRALSEAVSSLGSTVVYDPRKAPLARAVLSVLQSDPRLISIRARLATLTLPVADLAHYLAGMAWTNELHADAMAAITEGLGSWQPRFPAPEMEQFEALLASSGDERMRRLAVTALQLAAQQQGWTTERLARLSAYSGDHAPLVAAAAQFTFPTERDDEDAQP